ncbi:MAG: histidine phosphatase family protein [Gammaproteobacteria bacterium]
MQKLIAPLFVMFLLVTATPASAQFLTDEELLNALREGGLVMVMRHASSPADPPDAATANPDNSNRERQLDAAGRAGAMAMGEALRRLGIPFAEVLSSPAYRTVETARYLGFTEIGFADFLGNQAMAASSDSVASALRQNLVLPTGTGNRLLITHSPNVAAAFPDLDPPIAQGEVLVFDPGSGQARRLGRIRIEQWVNF